jgi:hypothetical protein
MRRTSRKSRVSSLALAILLCAGVAHADDAKEKSRAAFKRGVAQLKAQDWAGARASFEQAWALYQHPSILLNLGIARLKTGDPVLAEQDLARFLSEDSGSSADEIAGAREALADARSKIGTLKVQVTPASARVLVDGKAVEVFRPTDGSDGVIADVREKAGKHVVAASAQGFASDQRDVDLPAKGEVPVKLALVKSASAATPGTPGVEHSQTRTIVAWSAVGLAGAGLALGTFAGLRAASLSDQYSKQGGDHYGDPSTRSSGITFRTAADVSFGVAILAGAAAAVLFFTDIGSGSATASTARRAPFVFAW